jgi:chaperonin GroES
MNFTKIKPLMNRVLVKKLVQPTKTSGGILIPDKMGGPTKIALIQDVGPGRYLPNGTLVKPSLKAGDYVLLPDYGGVKVPKKDQEENAEYFIYQEDDILGVVNDNLAKV